MTNICLILYNLKKVIGLDLMEIDKRRQSKIIFYLNLLLFSILVALFYRCPFRLIFGIDCPSCGMTRAFFAALRLDFKASLSYHPLFPIVAVEILYLLFRNRFKINGKAEIVIGVLTLLLLLIVWIIRQFLI